MNATRDAGNPSGFSLIELMTALTITMIVVGAIYGLLTGGQKAFRREPERTELQQNVRSAMDIVMRDVGNAGGGPGCDSSGTVCDGISDIVQPVLQVFTPALDGQGPAVPAGGNSDVLQMLYADPSCKPIPIDIPTGNVAGSLKLTNCFAANSTSIVFLFTSDQLKTYWGLAKGLAPLATKVTLAASQPAGANATLTPPGTFPGAASVGKLVRYQICTATGDTVPSLCRSETGGYDSGGNFVAAPDPTGGWQVVARGIEDLQVEYRDAAAGAAWAAVPDAVDSTNWTTMTKEVRVTLFGRGSLTRIEGQSGPAGVTQVLRAQLMSTGSPRAALAWLRAQSTTTTILWSSLIEGPGAWS